MIQILIDIHWCTWFVQYKKDIYNMLKKSYFIQCCNFDRSKLVLTSTNRLKIVKICLSTHKSSKFYQIILVYINWQAWLLECEVLILRSLLTSDGAVLSIEQRQRRSFSHRGEFQRSDQMSFRSYIGRFRTWCSQVLYQLQVFTSKDAALCLCGPAAVFN